VIPGPYRNLALIGFMGSGKTTAAAAIADRLGWRAVDADAEIEREAGRSIKEIFATDGEPTFRALEERVCLRLLHQTGVVVALGGGAVTSPLIRERLRDG
jgi:shikimate kinase